jgi:tRNA nucleotidyltransferase (CCA-adding enzyme)
MAQSEKHRQKKIVALDAILPVLDEIIEQQQCFSLKDLAVNGRDLMAIGIPEGTAVGIILNQLLESVINEVVENEKEQLLKIAHGISTSFC